MSLDKKLALTQTYSESSISDFFFGKKITATEIPLSKYTIKNNTISIVEYTEDGEGIRGSN